MTDADGAPKPIVRGVEMEMRGRFFPGVTWTRSDIGPLPRQLLV